MSYDTKQKGIMLRVMSTQPLGAFWHNLLFVRL